MKRNRLRRSLSLFLAACLFLLGGCSGLGEKKNAPDKVEFLIGVSQANLIEPWRIIMNEEIRQELSKHPEARLVFTDAAQSSAQQIRDVEQLMQQGIDLLIISPNDSKELTPIVAEAYKKLPVIVVDRAVEGYDYTLYIGPDNKGIGREAGKYTRELLGSGGGTVVELQGPLGVPSALERTVGFREVVEQHENIKIVSATCSNWQRDEAEDQMTTLLKKYPQVDIVFAHSDYMALGAYMAAKKLGQERIKIFGVDGFVDAQGKLPLIAEGILSGTISCPTGGREAAQYAMDILHREGGLPKKIITRSTKVTKATLEQYLQARSGLKKESENKKIVLGFSQVGAESDWRKANSQSIKSAAQADGIELLFAEGDQSQASQIKAIRSFIAQKVDVIAFSPVVEYGWGEVLREAKEAGIPVILSDRSIKPDDDLLYDSFIGSDFLEEGRRAARWLVDHTKDRPQVRILELEGTAGSGPAVDRKLGFAEIIASHDEYRILSSELGDFTKASGESLMKDALKRYGRSIDVVYAHNDDMALGAIQAISDYGLKPGQDIIIVSIDATAAAFRAMISGKLNCTVECTPLLGPQLMQAVKKQMAGRQIPVRIITSEGVFPAEVARQEINGRRY
ncbi:substrate-binding domain-containing protein [Azotosporobacter soli]|uniref:substrate-binding domain-containing protein n=1 Tax=Azotosporobacter soli TaxID=3055040 RepID=UPI0031FE8EBB